MPSYTPGLTPTQALRQAEAALAGSPLYAAYCQIVAHQLTAHPELQAAAESVNSLARWLYRWEAGELDRNTLEAAHRAALAAVRSELAEREEARCAA